MKQWSPRCSEAIREIYQNQAMKGVQFVAEGLKALKEELRVYKKADLHEGFGPTSFLQALRIPLKLETDEAETRCQLNFKLTKNMFLQLDRYRKKGFTDSQLLEAFLYLAILRRSPPEILEEERKEAPEIETKEPLEKKPSQTRQEGILRDFLANRCHTRFTNCISEPFEDEDGIWKVDCPKEILKRTAYGPTPTGKFYGIISIEKCRSLHESMIRYERLLKEKEIKKETKEKNDNLEAPQLLIPKKPKLSTEEILNQVGGCKNPLIIRQNHSFSCAICKKRDPRKREACDLIFKELETSPMSRMKFMNAMTSGKQDWWKLPKTEDMSLEEIERELGIRPNPPSYEDLKFDAFRKRYNELCEICEEHLHHRCHRYCRGFLNGLEFPEK